MRLWILAIFICFFGTIMAQDQAIDGGESAFAKANDLYNADDYQEAIVLYESILQSGQHSVAVYFNLANAHYKLNQVGPAIYNYEKALQLEPTNRDVLNNLTFAQQLRVDTVEKGEENPLQDTLRKVLTVFSVDNWAYLSIMLVLITVLLFILYNYAATTGKKRLMFTLSMVFFMAAIFCIVAAGYSQELQEESQQAIVYSVETITRTEPKGSAAASFAIHEGTKVTIIEEYEDWAKIEVANGSQSWMPLKDLRKL